MRLGALSADPAGELQVLRLDGHPLGVDGDEVGVLEEADQVRLRRLLKRRDGGTLMAASVRAARMSTRSGKGACAGSVRTARCTWKRRSLL